MSNLFSPPRSAPVGSFLYRNDLITKEMLINMWTNKFQVIEDNEHIEFEFCPMKKYYSKEMGDLSSLSRFFIYSKSPVKRSTLVELKLWADALERSHLQNKKRIFNFDIGLVSPENFLLATGKPYSHRVYLYQGVYAELTYIFEKKSFQVLPWTYPDYAQDEIIVFFNSLRQYSQKFSDIS